MDVAAALKEADKPESPPNATDALPPSAKEKAPDTVLEADPEPKDES
jgi:hypothetical protein